MLLQINGVGKQKITYKNHNDVVFDSLENYVLLAKKSISKFCKQFYQGLSTKMLKDEDAISSVANAMMMADWRWDENYQNEKGTKKTKYSYRNQCALWAIQTYVTKNLKKNHKLNKVYSLDYMSDNDENASAHSYTADTRTMSPEDIIILKENEEELKKLIESLLSLNCLTERQKDYIKLYYFESYTFDKIGQKYGITREAVRQGLNKALETIREVVK
jgi:RNA polymerase sigma factor (sigma-70 family)